MKNMSVSTRCKLQRAWLYTRMFSLGLFLSVAWASTGWFTRDVLATAERRDIRADFNKYIADNNEAHGIEIKRQADFYGLLLKEKDDRIQELANQVSILAEKTGKAASTAQQAATKADKALKTAPAVPSAAAARENAATKRAVEEANKRIKKAGESP